MLFPEIVGQLGVWHQVEPHQLHGSSFPNGVPPVAGKRDPAAAARQRCSTSTHPSRRGLRPLLRMTNVGRNRGNPSCHRGAPRSGASKDGQDADPAASEFAGRWGGDATGRQLAAALLECWRGRFRASAGRSRAARRCRAVVVVEAAAQPAAPAGHAAAGMQFERRLRGRRARTTHGPRRAATTRSAAAPYSRRRRTHSSSPAPVRGSARSLSPGATTSDEPGTMRNISAIRWRALNSEMPPAADAHGWARNSRPAVNSGSRSAAVMQVRTVCTSATRSTRYSTVGSCCFSPIASVSAKARPRVNSAFASQPWRWCQRSQRGIASGSGSTAKTRSHGMNTSSSHIWPSSSS